MISNSVFENTKARALLNESPDCIFSVAEGMQLTGYNRSFVRLFSILLGHIEEEKDFFNQFQLQERTKWENYYKRILEEGKLYEETTWKFNPLDIHLEIRGTLLEQGSDEVVFFVRDITEQKVLNDELRKQYVLREIAFDQALIGYFEWDLTKGSIRFSENATRMYELPSNMGSLYFDFFVGLIESQDQQRFENAVREALEKKGSYTIDFKIKTASGSTKFVYSAGRVICSYDGRPETFVGVLQDITERKLSEVIAKENEKKLAVILKSTNEAVALFDNQGRFVMTNEAFDIHWNQLWRNIERKNWGEDNPLFEKISPFIQKAITSKQVVSRDIFLHQGNTSITYQVNINPIFENDNFEGLSLFIYDITERVNLTNQIIKLTEAAFEQRIREDRLQSELLVQGQEMERSRISRELHDGIGQMLHALKLKVQNQNESIESIRSYITEIITETKRVCNDLMPLSLESFGLAKGLAHLVDKFDKESPEIEISLYSDFEERLDNQKERNIYRIVQELVNNSVKYSSCSYIELQMMKRGNNLVITMEEDGQGFDVEQMLSMEEKGYGLKNMYYRASLLDAKLTLDSSPGNGLVANLIVPLS